MQKTTYAALVALGLGASAHSAMVDFANVDAVAAGGRQITSAAIRFPDRITGELTALRFTEAAKAELPVEGTRAPRVGSSDLYGRFGSEELATQDSIAGLGSDGWSLPSDVTNRSSLTFLPLAGILAIGAIAAEMRRQTWRALIPLRK